MTSVAFLGQLSHLAGGSVGLNFFLLNILPELGPLKIN
jgi:hypothetical protein